MHFQSIGGTEDLLCRVVLVLVAMIFVSESTASDGNLPDMAVVKRYQAVQTELRRFWSDQLAKQVNRESEVQETVFQVVKGSQVLLRVPSRSSHKLESLRYSFESSEGLYESELEGLHAAGREDYHWHVLRIPFRVNEPVILNFDLEFSENLQGAVFSTATKRTRFKAKASLPMLGTRLQYALLIEFETEKKIAVKTVDLNSESFGFSGDLRQPLEAR